jgi:hypothetical protein
MTTKITRARARSKATTTTTPRPTTAQYTAALTKTRTVEADSIESAAARVAAYAQARGSSRWYREIGDVRGSAIRDASGTVVAHVSYNGRVFPVVVAANGGAQ